MMKHTVQIVGSYYRPPAKAILAALPIGQELTLRRQPENEADPKAIAIFLRTVTLTPAVIDMIEPSLSGYGFSRDDLISTPEWHLGYVPRVVAETLALAPDWTGVGSLTCGMDGHPKIAFSTEVGEAGAGDPHVSV